MHNQVTSYKSAYIEDIFSNKFKSGQAVHLRGWVYHKRSSGKIKFLMFRDGSGIIQSVLFKGETPEEALACFSKLHQEHSLEIKGKIFDAPKAPGKYEIHVDEIIPLNEAFNYPITPKEHGPAFLLDHRHLWIRSKKQMATLRIRAEIIRLIRKFFDDQGFIGFDTPIFTPNSCEGTSDLFEMKYFDDETAYLTQSGQLYAEAGALAFGRVYTFGPTFRAEKSKTRRHLTEFWMVEPEVAFMNLEQDIALAEGLIEYVVQNLIKTRSHELELLDRDVEKLKCITAPFPRMSYDEAADILEKESVDGFKKGMDFGGGDETILSSKDSKPLIVDRFPKKIKAFYMKEDPENDQLSLSFDILAPQGYGEIVGGSERETCLKTLNKKIKEHRLKKKDFAWYLDLRKFGSVPHSGFGLGVERLTAFICGTPHVRECIPFPRMINRLKP